MSKKVTLRCGNRTTITSRKNAERYERHGRARRVSDSLFEMLDDDPRHQAAERSAAAGRCYLDGFASVKSVQNLPCAGDALRLFMGKRPAQPPREDRVRFISSRRILVCA